MLPKNGDFCSLMLAMLSMSLIRQLCCGLFDMSGPLVPGFASIPIVTGVHLWSITTMALGTFFIVRKVLHRGILWLWWLMVSPLSHSFVSSRLSSLNFSMLGYADDSAVVGPWALVSQYFHHLQELVLTLAIFWRPPAVFLLLLPLISLLLRHSSPSWSESLYWTQISWGFFGESNKLADSWLLSKIDHWLLGIHKLTQATKWPVPLGCLCCCAKIISDGVAISPVHH